MKNTLLVLFLFFALSTKPLLGAASTAPEQVVDTSGKVVRAGLNYYIVPTSPNVGGLSLTSTGESTCPLDVVLTTSDPNGYRGQPVVFQPVNVKKALFVLTLISTSISHMNQFVSPRYGCSRTMIIQPGIGL
ncbi:Trypsin inhibitor [Arachis hypogaea]|nr:Trypsin inhibitor [Arachis hypogaea]